MTITTHGRDNRFCTGTAGEFYVAAEIFRRNAFATVTNYSATNAPRYDLVVSNREGTKTAFIQVKTGRDDAGGYIVGGSAMPEYADNAFHVFVLIKADAAPEYWIIPSSEVSRIAEDDYQRWLVGRPESSSTAPRTFKWKYLRSEEFGRKYRNQWNLLGIFGP